MFLTLQLKNVLIIGLKIQIEMNILIFMNYKQLYKVILLLEVESIFHNGGTHMYILVKVISKNITIEKVSIFSVFILTHYVLEL